MKNRTDIKDFILQIENDFPVNDWKVNHTIELWPIIRIQLFFYLLHVIEIKGGVSEKVTPFKIQSEAPYPFYKKIIRKIQFKFWLSKFKKKEIVFVGADSHRLNYQGKRFNRFFDSMVEMEHLENQFYYLENGDKVNRPYKDEKQVIFSEKFRDLFRVLYPTKPLVELDSYEDFLNYLDLIPESKYFSNICNIDKVNHLAHNLIVSANFYEKILKRIRPQKMLILCYYDLKVYPMIIAAKRLNIQVIEMQHGSQTDLHLAYGSWSKVPENGYQVMPTKYWEWNEDSAKTIEKWAKNTSNCEAKVVGNYWVSYWKQKGMNYSHRNYILYCLQPVPPKREDLFADNIVNFIKNQPYKWFIRLHPRQLEEKEEIIQLLKDKGIFDLVNIEDATNDFLPQLLSNCLINATHFSTTTIEAESFDKHTVLLSETGEKYYPDQLKRGTATYIDFKDKDFEKNLIQVLEKHLQ